MSPTPPPSDDETTTFPRVTDPADDRPDPIDMVLSILRARRQALLPRQLANTLERMALPTTPATVEDLLRVAARKEPRLRRDDLGRWRFETATPRGP